MPKSTKYYSTLQEHRIAEFYGWKTVSASGARPFNPGDVKSPDWLAECKTHVKEIERLTISKAVWRKLANEAKSKRKFPVLFIDNGTQKLENTWAIIPGRFIDGKGFESIDGPLHMSEGQITFKHTDMKSLFRRKKACVSFFIDSNALYIVKATDLQEVVGEV